MTENAEDTVYLSEQLIRRWQDEYVGLASERADVTTQVDQLNKRVTEINGKLTALQNKLKSAVPFNPKLIEWLQEQEFMAQPENVALTDAILKVFLRFPAPQQIPRQNFNNILPAVGYSPQRLQANPTYLYIALKRLIVRELIEEPTPGQFRITNKGREEAMKKK
jgi:hypothetical protein